MFTKCIVCYDDDGSKKLNVCIWLLLHMVYLQPKQKSMLFAENMYKINMHPSIYLQCCLLYLTLPCSHLWFTPFPFVWINCPFYLLGDPSSCDIGANIHPLSSLVSYQLFSPCCLTQPKDTPRIKLHVYIDDITSAALSDTRIMTKRIKRQNI